MKLVKSLLLGTAAGFATVAGANAADLPVRKAAAVEYVQLCPAFGRGFFTIPGTETCLQISGRVRAEFLVREQDVDSQDATGFRARGRLNIDARTATAFGPLRAYIRYEATSSSGAGFVGGITGFAGLGGVGGLGGGGQTGTVFALEQAYVQWGGFIAGKNTSLFSLASPRGDRYFGARFDDGPNIEQFAYVADLGGGLTIAGAIENPLARRTNTGAFAGVVGAGVVVPPGNFAFAPGDGLLAYGGQELPDLVGAVVYTGTWGTAFLTGALHQVNDVGVSTTAVGAGGFGPVVTVRPAQDDELGFAVAGFVDVGLPMIAAGTNAWVYAGYADGAVSYVGYGIGGPDGGGALAGASFVGGIGNAAIGGLPVTDAVVIGGSLQTTEAFTVAGGLRFQFAPQVRSNIYGSYSMVDFAGGASSTILAGPFAGARTGFVDFEEGFIAGNVIYTPVAGLDLGVEILYRHIDPQGSVIRTRPAAGGGFVQTLVGDEDVIAGRFRVERNF